MSKQNRAIGVIMAGGLGERFWPMSNQKMPKYAVPLDGKTTFLEFTYKRLQKIYMANDIWVVTSYEHKKLIQTLLPNLPKNQILTEPFRRNTAAATYYTTRFIHESIEPNAILSFFPADAWIETDAAFAKTMRASIKASIQKQCISVIGIKPTRPATGYGYIESGAQDTSSKSLFKVRRFCEKPELKVAKRFVKSGKFMWNAGIFTWPSAHYLDLMCKHAPEFQASVKGKVSANWMSPKMKAAFKNITKGPIDKVLIEKLNGLYVIAASIKWDDIGSWEALKRMMGGKKGNVCSPNVVVSDSNDNIVMLNSKLKVIIHGVQDLVVIQDGETVLITDIKSSEAIREVKHKWLNKFEAKS
ncbi:MAG: mannose-1-phosphate guanylyltransferase [Candidatus Omnitrophota bacterium]|jgi:mannose-1-phosphate guanylyltransferase